MKWIIIYWIIAANGHIVETQTLDGFATAAECDRFGATIPVESGIVRWHCTPEEYKR